MALTSAVRRLHAEGILRAPDAPVAPRSRDEVGFGHAAIHVAMLEDRPRTDAFLDAIARTVRPGDVVVEIGTGTGILAMAAARAGARRVFAIEATQIAASARAVVEANALGDRVSVVEGWSSEVTLPEPGDVLVSEIIGNDPFGEQVLEATLDARRRLLKPGARLVPSRVTLVATPVSIPAASAGRWRFTAEAVARWRGWYGFDLSPVLRDQRDGATVDVRPATAREWTALGSPATLASVDLATFDGLRVDGSTDVEIRRDGLLNAVVGSFDLDVAPEVRLTSRPDAAADSSSWSNPVWLLPESRRVREGERITLRYRRRAGPPSGLSVEG